LIGQYIKRYQDVKITLTPQNFTGYLFNNPCKVKLLLSFQTTENRYTLLTIQMIAFKYDSVCVHPQQGFKLMRASLFQRLPTLPNP